MGGGNDERVARADMAVSPNCGTMWTPNTTVLVIGNPQKDTRNFEKPHLAILGNDSETFFWAFSKRKPAFV